MTDDGDETECQERPGAPQYYEQTPAFHLEEMRRKIRKNNVLSLKFCRNNSLAEAERDLQRLLVNASVSVDKSCEIVNENNLEANILIVGMAEDLHKAVHCLHNILDPVGYALRDEEEWRERR